jgi:DNA-binding CsgD family transcriptional regulator
MLPSGVETKRVGHHVYRYWNPQRGTAREAERIRLYGDPLAPPNSPEWKRFFRELEGAMEKIPVFAPGSIGAFITDYRRSDEFTRLSESSQKSYNTCLNKIIVAWGRFGANELTPPAVLEGRDAMKETPGMANQLLSVGRTFYSWGIPLGYAKGNPFDAVGPLAVKDNGHVPWSRWVSDYVLAKAPPDLVRMVRLGMMTCQRESDLVRLGPEQRERNGLWCRPQKTKRKRRAFFIPLGAADALELDRWAETAMVFKAKRWLAPIARHRADLYLYSPKGAPFNPTSLRARYNRWLNLTPEGKELCRLWQEWLAAQVRKYEWEIDPEESLHPTIHGLRGTGILLRRAEGYSNEQISNDVGMSLQMVEHYMRFKDQMEVAERGQRRLQVVE